MKRDSVSSSVLSTSLLYYVLVVLFCFVATANVSALVTKGTKNNKNPSDLSKSQSSSIVTRTLVDQKRNKSEQTSILLKIGYDGSHYTGWSAANKSQRSVEGELKKKLAKILGNLNPECVIVEGCSRTDKGVHAQAMVAQVYAITPAALEGVRNESCQYPGQPSIPGKRYPHPWNSTDLTECFVPISASVSKIGFALNRMSGDDLRVFAGAPSPRMDTTPFHPTLHSRCKTYRYSIATGSLADPIRRKRVWHVGKVNDDLFVDRMREAAALLEGVHDFTTFSCIPKGPQDRKRRKGIEHNGICHLTSLQVISTDYKWRDNREITLTITGDRFLYKMVRMLVGTLVAFGMEKISESQLKTVLASGECLPNHTIECAPAHGLVLEHVDYDIAIEWEAVNS